MADALSYATLGYTSETALQEPAVGLASLGYISELSGDVVLRVDAFGAGSLEAILRVGKPLAMELVGAGSLEPLLRVEKPLILALLGEGSMSPGLEVIVPWVDIVDGTVYITLRMEDDVVR